MTDSIRFFVHGLPISQGSTRTFTPKGWTQPVITSTSKGLKAWRTLIASEAQRHAADALTGPVEVIAIFYLPKPKSAPKTRRTWPDRKPDIDKLIRALLDALTYVLFDDDARVVRLMAEKRYANDPMTLTGLPAMPVGVGVEVRAAAPPPASGPGETRETR